MISRFIIAMMKNDSDQILTRNGLRSRLLVLLILLGVIIFLFVLILLKLKMKSMRIITALFLSAVLIYEAMGVIPYLQWNKHIALEYVGSVETTRDDLKNGTVKWFTQFSIPEQPEGSLAKEWLEECLECDLTDIELNDNEYTYLFILYYKDVDLYYSVWSEGKVESDYWIWHIDAKGEATDNMVYIYKFPRNKYVMPTGLGEMMWWEILVCNTCLLVCLLIFAFRVRHNLL